MVALIVPSRAGAPLEHNVVINLAHHDAKKLRVESLGAVPWDLRLFVAPRARRGPAPRKKEVNELPPLKLRRAERDSKQIFQRWRLRRRGHHRRVGCSHRDERVLPLEQNLPSPATRSRRADRRCHRPACRAASQSAAPTSGHCSAGANRSRPAPTCTPKLIRSSNDPALIH